MPQPVTEQATTLADKLGDWYLAFGIGLLMVGILARRLIGDEPLNWRKLLGEFLLAVVFGVGLWASGISQGLSGTQMAVLFSFAALGGGRSIELLLRLAAHFKGKGS